MHLLTLGQSPYYGCPKMKYCVVLLRSRWTKNDFALTFYKSSKHGQTVCNGKILKEQSLQIKRNWKSGEMGSQMIGVDTI